MRVLMPVRVTLAHGTGGGMERHTEDVARALARRGHEVTIVTTAHPAGVTECEAAGVRRLHMPGSTWRRYRRRWWRDSHEEVLRAAGARTPYDVILSQSAGALGYLADARRQLRLPTVVVLHGSARGELETGWRSARSPRGAYRLVRLGWRLPVQVARWRRAASSVAGWLAVSERVAADAARELALPPERLRVVPPAVDLERFRRDPAGGAAERARLGIRPDAPVAALAGRLEREKGFDLALRAAARLRRAGRDLRVLVAGDGHDRRRLERLAARLGMAEAVVFLGTVEHDRMAAVLAAADVFLLPSRAREGMPLVLVEAMATGLPVVATAAAAPPSVAAAVVVVPTGDVDALAGAAGVLLDDAEARRDHGRRARTVAETCFGEHAVVDAIERVLEDAVTGCSGGRRRL